MLGPCFSKWCLSLIAFLLPHLLISLLSPFWSTKTPTILSFKFLDAFVILEFILTTLTNFNFVSYLVFSCVLMNITFHLPHYRLLFHLTLLLIFPFSLLRHFFNQLDRLLPISPCNSPPLWSPFLLLHFLWPKPIRPLRSIRGAPGPWIILPKLLFTHHLPVNLLRPLLFPRHQVQYIP
jgi:hypothetical protein